MIKHQALNNIAELNQSTKLHLTNRRYIHERYCLLQPNYIHLASPMHEQPKSQPCSFNNFPYSSLIQLKAQDHIILPRTNPMLQTRTF